jgi:hypothetical protein
VDQIRLAYAKRVESADEIEVPSFGLKMKCSKCGGKNVDVRPNWKEQPPSESLTGKQWR